MFDTLGPRFYSLVLWSPYRAILLLVLSVALGASSAVAISPPMPQTYKIYGLIDPRNHRFYYVGQTRRALHDRLDEHFFESSETLVSEKNRAIVQSGQLPQVVVLDEVKDKRTAFHRELYWVHKLASEGYSLKNREAQHWFVRRYDDLILRRTQGKTKKQAQKREKSTRKRIPALKAETYLKAKEVAPGANVEVEEAAWRKWLTGPGKYPPENPDAHFLAWLGKAKK